jgi:hypothetical protein
MVTISIFYVAVIGNTAFNSKLQNLALKRGGRLW